jgi:peptide/nickel transport system permease protein
MSMPYVEAARAVGCSRPRLILTHLVRGLLPQLLLITTIYASGAVLAEASLGYLGLGIAPPEPSWGNMLSDARSYMTLAIFPGLGITMMVLGFSFVGDGLRDLLDPHTR